MAATTGKTRTYRRKALRGRGKSTEYDLNHYQSILGVAKGLRRSQMPMNEKLHKELQLKQRQLDQAKESYATNILGKIAGAAIGAKVGGVTGAYYGSQIVGDLAETAYHLADPETGVLDDAMNYISNTAKSAYKSSKYYINALGNIIPANQQPSFEPYYRHKIGPHKKEYTDYFAPKYRPYDEVYPMRAPVNNLQSAFQEQSAQSINNPLLPPPQQSVVVPIKPPPTTNLPKTTYIDLGKQPEQNPFGIWSVLFPPTKKP